MNYRKLGRTDIKVSSICLGTMTWGQQNNEVEAHEQIDYALGRGINFIDTAEMYPVPPSPQTQGSTERYVGSWLKASGQRSNIVLATKVTGRSMMNWVRKAGGEVRQSPAQISEALEGSLRRLQTDYIDLYQLHWPDRPIKGSGFGLHSYHDYDADDMIALEDILEALAGHMKEGKIRHIGVSNESPWAVMRFLDLAEQRGWPRIVSNQSVYSLISRRFDYANAEISMREQVGLLAYSPLAMGYLTGKYEGGALPKGSRKALFPEFLGRYDNPGVIDSVTDCVKTAKKLGLTPTQFALKFVESRDFVTSNIIGATSKAQLKENIDAHDIIWTDDMEAEADRIHRTYRSPVAG